MRKRPLQEPLQGEPSFEAALQKVQHGNAVRFTNLAEAGTATNFCKMAEQFDGFGMRFGRKAASQRVCCYSKGMSFLGELKRRNVIRVATAYVVAAWLIIQVGETLFPAFGFGAGAVRIAVIILVAAFIPVLSLSWVLNSLPQGCSVRQTRDWPMAHDQTNGI